MEKSAPSIDVLEDLRDVAASVAKETGAGRLGMRFGISAGGLQSEFSVASGVSRRSASLIKLPILLDLLDESRQGRVELDETLDDVPVTDGSGILQYLVRRNGFTLKDLAMLMIGISDNTATNALVERLGIAQVNEWCRESGLLSTHLGSPVQGHDPGGSKSNMSSVDDMFQIMRMIHTDRGYRDALPYLESQQLNAGNLGLCRLKGWRVYHKTGGFSHLKNDAALFERADGAWGIGVIMLDNFSDVVGPFSLCAATRYMTRLAEAFIGALASVPALPLPGPAHPSAMFGGDPMTTAGAVLQEPNSKGIRSEA